MTLDEWESLCDGCGRCCLNKIEDEETGDILHTNVVCALLDIETCRCTRYGQRGELVADCRQLTPDNIGKIKWLPPTCAYRLLDEGKELPWWHPLVSGDPGTVRKAGISLHGRIISEENIHPDQLAEHIIEWL